MRDLSRSPNELYLATYIMNESWTRTFVYSSKFSDNYILSHIYGSSPSSVKPTRASTRSIQKPLLYKAVVFV
jgi:hypothetical protein